MTIKKYLNENTQNCLLKGKKIEFQTIYSQYLAFKELGKTIIKELNINKIKIKNTEIFVPSQFIINGNLDYFITNFIEQNPNNDFNKNTIYNNINLAILSHTITKALKQKLKNINNISEVNFKNELEKIIEIQHQNKKNIDYEYYVSIMPLLFEKISENNKSLNIIDEKLECEKKTCFLINYLNFDNLFSLFFHYLKIELVFYSHDIKYNAKPPKICISCHKHHYLNSNLCFSCNEKRNKQRRSMNAKCKRLRDELKYYIETYSDIIDIKLKNTIKTTIEGNHKYTDLKQLQHLKISLKKELEI